MNTEKRIFGYARASSASQENSIEIQKEKLLGVGVPAENIYADTASGISFENRPGFEALVGKLRKGDVLYVTKVDRLSRTVIDSLITIDQLKKKGIEFRSFDIPNPDITNSEEVSMQTIIVTFLISLAEYEYQRRAERQKDGIEKLRSNPELWKQKYPGKKSYVDIVAKILKSYVNTGLPVKELRMLIGQKLHDDYKRKSSKPICLDLYYKALKKLKREKIGFNQKAIKKEV